MLAGKDGLAHDRILERVKNYSYPPQTRLTQDRLVDELNLGATPVRNALKLLHSEGIIGHEEHAGFFVKTPSLSEIRNLYRSVEVLTCGAIDVALRYELTAPASQSSAMLDAVQEGAKSAQAPGAFHANFAAVLFASICMLASGDAIMRTINNANDRLYFVRTVEWELLSETQNDLETMQGLFNEARLEELASNIAVFHKKRYQLLPDLVDRVYLRAINLRGE